MRQRVEVGELDDALLLVRVGPGDHRLRGILVRSKAMLTGSALRRHCLALPGSGESFPFGPGLSVFKVAAKIFALSRLGRRPLTVSLKCEPELAEQLRATYPAVRPGYHLNKRHWNTIEIDGSLPDRLLLDLVEDSYDLVVAGLPKRVQRSLGWPPAAVE